MPYAKQKKQQKPKVGKDGETILRVEPYEHFGKFTLRPFVTDGCALHLPKGVASEKKFLTVKKVFENISTSNS